MIIASIEGNIIVLLIAGVVGVLKYFTDKQKEQKEQEEIEYRRRQSQGQSPQSPASRPIPTTTQQSEEERLRKFLEALGVPTPPSNTPSTPRPAPTPPSPQQRPIPPPRTPPVQTPQPKPQVQYHKAKVAPQQQQRRPVLPQPKPQPVFEHEMDSMESEGAGSTLTYGNSIEQIRKDFDADILPAMEVSATTKANDKRVASAYVLPATEFAPSANTANLIAALRSPENLRTLILVREILGPPPSLQNS